MQEFVDRAAKGSHLCDPHTPSARMTSGGPCARRVRHGEPLRVIGRVTSVEVGRPVSSIRRVRRRGCARGTTKRQTAMAAKAPRLQISRLDLGERHR